MLESFEQPSASSFVTLTYAEPAPGSLDRKELQRFLKRLRTELEPARIRFFARGEYGEVTGRPHYHVAVFGMPIPADHGFSVVMRQGVSGLPELMCLCQACSTVRKEWKHGRIQIDRLDPGLAQYLAGYCLKKLERVTNPDGSAPEFVRMSLRPGIGAKAMKTVGAHLLPVLSAVVGSGDVPRVLAHGRKTLPLGRYLMRKLREALDFKETGAQPGWQMPKVLESLATYEAEGSNTARFREAADQVRVQKAVNTETKARIRAQRKKL